MKELNSTNLTKAKLFIEKEIDLLDGNLHWILILELHEILYAIEKVSNMYIPDKLNNKE